MNRKAALLFVTMLLGACASFSGGPFVSADEPHARLDAVINADITDTLFPGMLVKVDGKVIPRQNRRTYLLAPGEHVLAFEPDRDAIQEYEDEFGRNYQVPRIFFERAINVTLEEGKRYKFGVTIEKYNYSEWQPYLEEID